MRFLALLPLVLLLASAASSTGARKVVLGRSVEGRPVVAYELGVPASPRKVLVVGCIHGNECAGVAIVDQLRRLGHSPGSISGSCLTPTPTAVRQAPAATRTAWI